MDTFMCRECNENCHGKAEDFTVCSACRTGYEAEIERLQKAYRPADMIEYQEFVLKNERLRAALERIAGGCGGYSKAQHIAREALLECE